MVSISRPVVVWWWLLFLLVLFLLVGAGWCRRRGSDIEADGMVSISRPVVVWWWLLFLLVLFLLVGAGWCRRRGSYGVSPTTPPIETAPTIGHWGVLSLWHFRLARSGSSSGRRAARPIKQSDRPTRTRGGRRRGRFLFRLTDRGDQELELGWSWRPPLRPEGNVGFAVSGLAGAPERLRRKQHRQGSRTETATEFGPR